jgi:hypothetical protein
LSNPKQACEFEVFVQELTGIICGAAHINDIKMSDVKDFLISTKYHMIWNIDTSGELVEVADLIHSDIINNPMYNLTERTLMTYKPGSVQVGPGEFFFCFYDKDSRFGIDNQAGYDIITDGVATELKKLGTNFTDEKIFDKYHASEDVDRLLVVKPISKATDPLTRSQYSCIEFDSTPWRDVYTHSGKNGSLRLL